VNIGLYYYSVTGNTKKLVRGLRDALTEEGHKVEPLDMHAINSGEKPATLPTAFDLIIFALPVMVFRPPFAVTAFINSLPASNTKVEAHVLTTCGGMGGTTASEVKELLAPKGVIVKGAREFVCEESYIPFRKYLSLFAKKDLPDEKMVKRTKEWGKEITKGEKGRKFTTPLKGMVRKVWGLIGEKAPENAATMLLGPRYFEEALCTKCGLCAKLCPTKAITATTKTLTPKEGQPVGEEATRVGSLDDCAAKPENVVKSLPVLAKAKCVGCLACFNNCPTMAWRLKRFSKEYHYKCP
jgi:ferredoxin